MVKRDRVALGLFLVLGLLIGFSIISSYFSNSFLTGFVTYSSNPEGSNLSIWDDTESVGQGSGVNFVFYANFTDVNRNTVNGTFNGLWTNLTPKVMPHKRWNYAMAYDSVSNIIMLYGGENNTDVLNETWIYNFTTSNWTRFFPSTTPGPLTEHSIIFSETEGVFLLFSGSNGTNVFNETWIYNYSINTWTNKNVVSAPPALKGTMLAYDSFNNTVLLFGGDTIGIDSNETWQYSFSSNTWTNMNPAVLPPLRRQHSFVYDSFNKRVILYGGYGGSYLEDIWIYNTSDNTWTNSSASNIPFARADSSFIFDPMKNVSLLFGGATTFPNVFNDTWSYNFPLNQWTKLKLGLNPSERYTHKMVYSTTSDLFYIYGGYSGTDYYLDMWSFNFTDQSPVCYFSDNSAGSWSTPELMIYNESSTFYQFNKSFSQSGNYQYNVSCDGSIDNAGTINSIDDFTITNCIPPQSGDWIINESSSVLCENIRVDFNGTVYVMDDSNLTINNSIFNSTVISFRNFSRAEILNSTTFGNFSFSDNSSSLIQNSTIYFARFLNTASSVISGSTFNVFYVYPYYNLTLENASFINANFIINSGINLDISDSSLKLYLNLDPLYFNEYANIYSSSFYYLLTSSNSLINIKDSKINLTDFKGNYLITSKNVTFVSGFQYFSDNVSFVGDTILINRIYSIINSGNLILSGNITFSDKTLPSFSENATLQRFYPLFIYDGTNEVNGTLNITYNDEIIWSGTLVDSYALVNLTFNSTTYTNQYNIYSTLGYMGKISMLSDTPLNLSGVVSSRPLDVSLLTSNGTLFDDVAYLQLDSNKPVMCSFTANGGSSLNATKTYSYANISLRYNQTIYQNKQVVNSTEMPFVLSKNTFFESKGTNDNDLNYVEELYFGQGENSGKLSFLGYGVSSSPSNENASTYLYFANNTNNKVYNYYLKFNQSVIYNNFSEQTVKDDLEGSTINIQGKDYIFSSLSAIGSGNSISALTLNDGISNITLRGIAGKIQKNGLNIDNAYGYFLGTPGNWRGINITYYPISETYIKEGESYSDPVFNSFKFMFSVLNNTPSENISIYTINQNAWLKFTNSNNTLISIPYYANGTTQVLLGYNSSSPVLLQGQSRTVSSSSELIDTYFYYVTNNNEAHLLKISDLDTSSNILSLQDENNGIIYPLNYTNQTNYINVLILNGLGNISLNISSDNLQLTYGSSEKVIAKTFLNGELLLTQNEILFNENSVLLNNETINLSFSYNSTFENITSNYVVSNTFLPVSKIYANNDVKIFNTHYGSLIEYDNQDNFYITLNYPQNPVIGQIYLAENKTIMPTTIPSSRYATSTLNGLNLIELACTDGSEYNYFSLAVNVSREPEVSIHGVSVTTSTASINIYTAFNVTSSINYGITQGLGTVMSMTTLNDTHIYSLSGLASETTFYYNLTLYNQYGRSVISGPYSFTTNGEPIEYVANSVYSYAVVNTNPFATRKFADLKAGQSEEATLTYGKVPITKLKFTAKNDVDYAQFRFFVLKNSSTAQPMVDESKVFKYMNFSVTKTDPENFEQIEISFKVEKKWFEENGLDPISIVLNRYSGSWSELQTAYEYEDHFYHYYTAQVPGFSIFSITATKGSLSISKQTPVDLPQQPTNQGKQPEMQQPVQVTKEPSHSILEGATGKKVQTQTETLNIPNKFFETIKSWTQNKFVLPSVIFAIAIFILVIVVVVLMGSKNKIQTLAAEKMSSEEIVTELKEKGVYGPALEELRQFIAQSLRQGRPLNQIKATLLATGWEEHVVEEVFHLFKLK